MYSQTHTFAECRSCILKMLERYSSNGIENSCGEMKDIEKRLVSSINIHLRKLYAQFFRKTEKKEIILEAPEESDICVAVLPENFARMNNMYDENGLPVQMENFEISAITRSINTAKEFSGKYIIEYYVYPEKLSDDCADDTLIILPPILFDALCYMCASDLCPSTDGELFSKLTYKYREILENYYDSTRDLSSGRNSFYKVCARIRSKTLRKSKAVK